MISHLILHIRFELARLFGKQQDHSVDGTDMVATRSLESTLHPRPDLRDRRFATWDMDRRQRYLDAAYGEPQSLRRAG